VSAIDLDDFASFNFDYTLAGNVRDPFPKFARAREETPVLREANPFDPDGPPNFQVYRHADVTRLFKDNATFSSSNLRDTMGPAMGEHIILGMDEPEHRRHRRWSAPPSASGRWPGGRRPSCGRWWTG